MQGNTFKEAGYVVIKEFLDPVTVSTISRYFENKILRGEWVSKKNYDPVTGYSYYADPLIEVILRNYREEVEKIVGEELLPTYSYSRIYTSGEELKVHRDRPECEISVTVNVASVGNNSPIFMKYPGREENKYLLNPGDAVIYLGCEVEHWREKLVDDQLNVQFMLHYVKKNGINSNLQYDRRKKLGMPRSTG